MQKHLSIVAAAALTVGGMGLASVWADSAANPNAGQAAGQPAVDSAQQAGTDAQQAADRAAQGQGLEGTAQAPDAEGIRDALASSTEAAFTSGGFDDLVERFVDADRNRIGKDMPSDEELKSLNDQIQAFRDAWKAKYNQDFDIDNEAMVFNDSYQIMQGEIGEQARPAGERQPADPAAQPADPGAGAVNTDPNAPRDATDRVGDAAERTGDAVAETADDARDATVNAADRAQQATGVDRPGSEAADANRNDPGRNIATVQVAESHGMPALTVNMIHEFPDAWRIDVPDTLDAAKLQTNLTSVVSACMSMKDQWPADVNEAYRAVNHKVLAALHDKPVSAGAGAGAGAGASGTGLSQ